MVSTEAQEIAPTTIDFNQPVSLAKFKAAIDRSPFRYSLYHYRRPGQPIGTTIAYNEATDKATKASKAAQPAKPAQPAQPAQLAKPAQPAQPCKMDVACPISAEEYTGMTLRENPPEVPYVIQQTDEGLFYVDYMDKDKGNYTYWRTTGKDREKLRLAIGPIISKIKDKLEGDAAVQ